MWTPSFYLLYTLACFMTKHYVSSALGRLKFACDGRLVFVSRYVPRRLFFYTASAAHKLENIHWENASFVFVYFWRALPFLSQFTAASVRGSLAFCCCCCCCCCFRCCSACAVVVVFVPGTLAFRLDPSYSRRVPFQAPFFWQWLGVTRASDPRPPVPLRS